MKELYINGILCDLSEKDNPIALTYEVNNLAELKDRQAYSTNNFKLPLTQKNRKACGFPDSGNIIGLQPYRKNACKIVQNGIEILTNGIAIITGCDNFINVQALSGLINFFDVIEGKSIRDLDLSEYEHVWNVANIVSSQENTEGYIWPIIDYGSLSEESRIVNVRELRPAMFRKTIIDKIISEAGFTYEGNILSDPKHLNVTLPFSLDKFEHGKSFINAANSYSASARCQANQGLANNLRDGVLNFTDDFATDPGNNWNGSVYTAPATMKAKVALKYTLDVRDQHRGGGVPSIAINIQKNSGSGWNVIAGSTHMAGGDFQTVTYPDQPLETEVSLNSGDQIRIAWHSEPATDRVLGVIYAGSEVAINYIPTEVIFGQAIQLEATLPDISQKDFFKEFLQNFGLIVMPDTYKKHIRLINMSEVYANKYKALDWTDKFTDSIQKTDYSFGNYGINNYGKYKSDNAVPDATGTGVMIFDNQTLKQDVDLFTSKFTGSLSFTKMSGISVTQIKKIVDPEKSLDFNTKTEPRILLDEKVNTTIIFTDGNIASSASVVSIPKFAGLGYDYLFPEYYSEILRMLYRPFTIDRKILLNPVDLANLDFTIPIYDRNTGAYYYNNGIKNYIDGEECTISLIKMQ